MKTLEAQTVMRQIMFAANWIWKYGSPVTSKTENGDTYTNQKAVLQNA
jgi:hypothetical protein